MFPEEGRSGALDPEDRVALTAAIDMIVGGKAEGLVCFSLDRLAREITVQEAILAKVWERSAGESSPPTRARSCAMTRRPDADRDAQDGWGMYELDRRLVVARLRRGRRLKAERDIAPGHSGGPETFRELLRTKPGGR